ncbi:MAG: FGGY family carbohydrate kinase [Rikenellaceae bacterium]
MKTLGIDIGSSSIKVSMLDTTTGECSASVTLPSSEMKINAPQAGWAEQSPSMWWDYVSQGVKQLTSQVDKEEIKAIGITYQMHGLVCLDKSGEPLRDSIIWCDSRAVEIGAEAFESIGAEKCLEQTLNSPGNFTASKLAWVKANQPEIFSKVDKFMLPGDYILSKLCGDKSTTYSGLSEQILWDFKENKVADFILDYYGISSESIPELSPSIGVQGSVLDSVAAELGLPEGVVVSYRAGDQPNNAFSLNVMEPGEIAATGGTSGVVYGVTDQPKADSLSRVNTFLHVNHSAEDSRYGVLLCINGTGILNAWVKRAVASEISYEQVNELCEGVPVGSDGVVMLPFGNGAERMLENRYTGAVVSGLDLNRHTNANMLRAAQEGIAFAFKYGIEIMKEVGLSPSIIRAGKANLFLSPIFRETLATLCDAKIELYNTDGALGAARGAALGVGIYANREQAFSTLRVVGETLPNESMKQILSERYEQWCSLLEKSLN